MKLTAGQAAKATGKSTATITRAINKRTLSADKLDGGGYLIEPSELFRVFPAVARNSGAQEGTAGRETPTETGVLKAELELMGEKLRSASALNDRLADEVADLRARLDQEGEERRKLTAILTDQRARETVSDAAPPLPPPPPADSAAASPQGPRRGGLWVWLLGR